MAQTSTSQEAVMAQEANARLATIRDVRFCPNNVRFTPESGHWVARLHVRFVPIADIAILIRSPRQRGKAAAAAR
jgi:hypothetical protein